MKLGSAENPVLQGCLALLGLRGIFSWRNNNLPVYDPARKRFRSFVGLKGASDILGVLPSGRFLAVETKAPAIAAIGQRAGRLTPEQYAFLDAVHNAGGVGVYISDVRDLESVLDVLELSPWQCIGMRGEVL